ncbi:MAG: hypothetical protein HRT47_13325 [Candidatus Caenarcaniphilales bacterium]|nr:hypothetical protein [Candidatus Caenarcaniphilales bacterium]
MAKKITYLLMSFFLIIGQAVSAETLNANLRINSIRVQGKKSKVFDRISIKNQSYDIESVDLSISDSEGIVRFDFLNINNNDNLSSLLNESKGTKVDLTDTISEIVFTENDSESEGSLVFNFDVKKAKARRTKKGIIVNINTETKAFDCEAFDLECDGEQNLKLKGRINFK